MAEAAKKIDLPAEPRYVPPLTADRWKLKEHANPGHWLCVHQDVTVEDMLLPGFWANVAQHLRPASTVEVHWDDLSQFAEFYVKSSGRNWASVDLMRHIKIGAAVRPSTAHQYEVAFNGPVDKFRVMNITNRTVLKAGFASEADARKFLDEHLKKH